MEFVMSSAMTGYLLIYTAKIGYFQQIAVLLNIRILYQWITKSVFRRSNDLVMVLLTGIYFTLPALDNYQVNI